jgi:hypothetical protein
VVGLGVLFLETPMLPTLQMNLNPSPSPWRDRSVLLALLTLNFYRAALRLEALWASRKDRYIQERTFIDNTRSGVWWHEGS